MCILDSSSALFVSGHVSSPIFASTISIYMRCQGGSRSNELRLRRNTNILFFPRRGTRILNNKPKRRELARRRRGRGKSDGDLQDIAARGGRKARHATAPLAHRPICHAMRFDDRPPSHDVFFLAVTVARARGRVTHTHTHTHTHTYAHRRGTVALPPHLHRTSPRGYAKQKGVSPPPPRLSHKGVR